jgi:hypothetical protein
MAPLKWMHGENLLSALYEPGSHYTISMCFIAAETTNNVETRIYIYSQSYEIVDL